MINCALNPHFQIYPELQIFQKILRPSGKKVTFVVYLRMQTGLQDPLINKINKILSELFLGSTPIRLHRRVKRTPLPQRVSLETPSKKTFSSLDLIKEHVPNAEFSSAWSTLGAEEGDVETAKKNYLKLKEALNEGQRTKTRAAFERVQESWEQISGAK